MAREMLAGATAQVEGVASRGHEPQRDFEVLRLGPAQSGGTPSGIALGNLVVAARDNLLEVLDHAPHVARPGAASTRSGRRLSEVGKRQRAILAKREARVIGDFPQVA